MGHAGRVGAHGTVGWRVHELCVCWRPRGRQRYTTMCAMAGWAPRGARVFVVIAWTVTAASSGHRIGPAGPPDEGPDTAQLEDYQYCHQTDHETQQPQQDCWRP